MKELFTICLATLVLAACSRDGDEAGTDAPGDVQVPVEVVAVPGVVPMPDEVRFRPLPPEVTEITTVDELRIHARIVAQRDLEANYILAEEIPERIDFLLGEWIPALEDLRDRVARAQAMKTELADRDLQEATRIAAYEAEGARIEHDHYRAVKEDAVKQIRIISEQTYRDLHNLGMSPGCRIGASRPPE